MSHGVIELPFRAALIAGATLAAVCMVTGEADSAETKNPPGAMISVKVVKSEPGLTKGEPKLVFFGKSRGWTVSDRPYHSGENDWEIFFEVEHPNPNPPVFPEMVIHHPGVTAARLIVGKTDVEFAKADEAGRTRFRLIDDRSRGQQIEVVWKRPESEGGGWPIHFRPNWSMRRAGKYAEGRYPATELAAIHNYLLAAHEVLRVMGDMGPGPGKSFPGEIVLMGTEIATTRGHMDFPPHVHLMYYEWKRSAAGSYDWIQRLVPHFYLNAEGEITRNAYTVVAGTGQSRNLVEKETCRLEDAAGNPVLDLIIGKDGLLMRRPDGAVYNLRPDPKLGAAKAVIGLKGEVPICRASATNIGENGEFRFAIETLEPDGSVASTFRSGFRYDPFTGKQISEGIRPSPENPRYWELRGSPTLLLGGSVEDNLFQIPQIESELDTLASCGGNFVRCTLSGRDEGNRWPFSRLAGGKYDLDGWDAPYWDRFERFLRETSQRGIVVQIELWATYDFYSSNWDKNPFNPKNNINYSRDDSWLPDAIPGAPARTENNFFYSIPGARHQELVLKYQKRFADKVLFHTLLYGHVLYCIDNEATMFPEWGRYWAKHLKQSARMRGRDIFVTEMWEDQDLAAAIHANTFDRPEDYGFAELSQGNLASGEAHGRALLGAYARLDSHPRPINHAKVYGADTFRLGSDDEGVSRFWRAIFSGAAAARFHRPPAGLGLTPKAQSHIRSARWLSNKAGFARLRPATDLLDERASDEAWALAGENTAAVFFPNGGEVDLRTEDWCEEGEFSIEWLDANTTEDQIPTIHQAGEKIHLAAPKSGPWIAYIRQIPS